MCARSRAAWLVGASLLAGFHPASAGFVELSPALHAPLAAATPQPQPARAGWIRMPEPIPLRSSIDEGRDRAVPDPDATGSIRLVPEPVPPGTSPAPAGLPEGPGPAAAPAPPGSVASTPADPLAAAIEARLADPKLAWPVRLGKKEREAIGAWYRAAAFRPVWLADGAWTERARSVQARFDRAGEDGLDPAAYPRPVLAPGAAGATPPELADAELKLSALAVLFARDARGGRIDPARLSPLMTPKLDLPAADALLAQLSAAPDAGAVLDGLHPGYPAYRALKEKLAELRAGRVAGRLDGPAGARPGLARPAPVRQTVAILDGEAPLDLPGPGTAAFGPRLEGDILANMERWRWLPAQPSPRAVVVNLPEFQLRVVEGGAVTHQARVIVGRPDTPTPIVSGLMDQAIVNPSWYIPPSIMKNEILPGLARDPSYAARRGYEVTRRGNAVTVRQPPGERNALGFIKFLFPNNHAVYLHDTPNRNLFGSARRAFSHGCVRVDQPFRFADAVLGAEWTEARLKKLIGWGERPIPLPEKLPVHFVYFTLEVGPGGEVRAFDDLYGYHRRVRAALGLGA